MSVQDATEQCEDRLCKSLSYDPRRIWYCVDCSSSFCEECWALQTAHQDGKVARDKIPHEKTNKQQAKRLEEILHPTSNEAEIRDLHEHDEDSIWIGKHRHRSFILRCSQLLGWSKDNDNRPVLEDYGVYTRLMANTPTETFTKHPQLVSFIGQTSKYL